MCLGIISFIGKWVSFQGPHYWIKFIVLLPVVIYFSKSSSARGGTLCAHFPHHSGVFVWLALVHEVIASVRSHVKLLCYVWKTLFCCSSALLLILKSVSVLPLLKHLSLRSGVIKVSHLGLSSLPYIILYRLTRSEFLWSKKHLWWRSTDVLIYRYKDLFFENLLNTLSILQNNSNRFFARSYDTRGSWLLTPLPDLGSILWSGPYIK